jgi:hypothetical protein
VVKLICAITGDVQCSKTQFVSGVKEILITNSIIGHIHMKLVVENSVTVSVTQLYLFKR